MSKYLYNVSANKDNELDTRCSRMYMEFRGVMQKKLNVLLSYSYIKRKDLPDEYAYFASTERPFRFSGLGCSVETVCF